jgi:integrase
MKGHIRQRGRNSWQLKFDAGRDPVTGERQIAFHTFRGGKREAQAKLAELIASVRAGTHVNRSSLTVGEHVIIRIDTWEGKGDISPKTAERYRELHANQIAPYLGSMPLQQLRSVDVERWHGTLKRSGRKDGTGGLAPITIRHAHRLLSKVLKEAQRHDLVVRNVAATESPPKVARDEVIILNDEQVRTTVTALTGMPLYLPVALALFAGMRRGEILALRWQHVDLAAKRIMVRAALEETTSHGLRFKDSKSDAGQRDIVLPDIVVEALREYQQQQQALRLKLEAGKLTTDQLLFARLDGAPLSPNALSKTWTKFAASIGLAGVTFHALRHTHASHLIDAGVDVVKISKRLGHSSPTVTLDTYAHLFARREDKSAAAINTAVTTLLSI